MVTVLKTAPTTEPIDLVALKEHLQMATGDTTHDNVLVMLIKAVRKATEKLCWRALISQTWYAYFNQWPQVDYLLLPFPPLTSVTAVKYTGSDGSVSTFSSSNYIVDTKSQPGRVVLGYGQTWPGDTLYPSNPIEVEFVAGYGTASSAVPEDLRLAMMVMCAHFFDNREPFLVASGGGAAIEIPGIMKFLFSPYRIWNFTDER